MRFLRAHRTSPARRRVALAAVVAAGTLVAGCEVTPDRRSADALQRQIDEARSLQEQGLSEEAIAAFEAVLEDNPNLTEAQIGLASIYEEQGDLTTARDRYQQATESDPTSFTAHYKLGLMRQLLGDVNAAIRTYLRARALDPDNFEVNRDLAAAYIQVGAAGEALPYAERAVELNPQSQQAWSNLAATYSLLGRYTEAIDTYRQAAEIGELADPVLLGLADAHIRLGNFQRAINTLTSLIQRSPTSTAYERMGYAQYKLRRFEEALSSFERALSYDARDTAALNGVGVALMTLYIEGGRESVARRDRALASWRRSVQINSQQPRIIDLLARYGRF